MSDSNKNNNEILSSLSKDDVVNKETLSHFEDLVTCKICLGLVNYPKVCKKCQTVYCKDCLKSYFNFIKKKQCPFEHCGNDNFYTSKIILKLYDKLIFKCKNGCNQSIPYNKLAEHYLTHSNKELKIKKIKDKDLSFDEEDISESSELFEDSNNSKKSKGGVDEKPDFILNSHHHDCPLYLVARNNGWNCDVCHSYYKYLDASFYCSDCDFDLCIKCAGY